jgi:hypothetical protein
MWSEVRPELQKIITRKRESSKINNGHELGVRGATYSIPCTFIC